MTAMTGAETMEFGPENGGHLPTLGDGGVWGRGRRFRRRAKTAVPTSGREVTAISAPTGRLRRAGTARPAPGTTSKPSGKSRILALTALTGAETVEFGPENGGHLPTVGDGGVWGSGRRFRRRAKTAVPTSGREVTAIYAPTGRLRRAETARPDARRAGKPSEKSRILALTAFNRVRNDGIWERKR